MALVRTHASVQSGTKYMFADKFSVSVAKLEQSEALWLVDFFDVACQRPMNGQGSTRSTANMFVIYAFRPCQMQNLLGSRCGRAEHRTCIRDYCSLQLDGYASLL